MPDTEPTTMYDDVDLSLIPLDAPAVAGYLGGTIITYPDLARRWPHARLLSYAVNASTVADLLDVERWDAVPAEVPAWLEARAAEGRQLLGYYSSLSNVAQIEAMIRRRGAVPRSRYRVIAADWTGLPHIPAGCDGCQWTDRAEGRSLDQTLLRPGFWPEEAQHVDELTTSSRSTGPQDPRAVKSYASRSTGPQETSSRSAISSRSTGPRASR
jgi:hypothetical protein